MEAEQIDASPSVAPASTASPAAAENEQIRAGKTLGESGKKPELPKEKPLGEPKEKTLGDSCHLADLPQEKNVGQILGQIPVTASNRNELGRIAQRITPRIAQWFRYELDIRAAKVGFTVIIRKRLRWSGARYSRTISAHKCELLTPRMVKQIRDGRLSQSAKDAFLNGGISNELIARLINRDGKGHGERSAKLTDNERAFLARLEHSLRSSARVRIPQPDDRAERRLDLSDSDVRGTSDGDFANMPNVH